MRHDASGVGELRARGDADDGCPAGKDTHGISFSDVVARPRAGICFAPILQRNAETTKLSQRELRLSHSELRRDNSIQFHGRSARSKQGSRFSRAGDVIGFCGL